MSILLVLAVLAPLAGAALTLALAPRLGERAATATVAACAVALLAAVALLVAVGAGGEVAIAAAGGEGAGLAADRLAAVLLVLVTLVGLVVTAFAIRYLQGDPRHARFFALTGLCVTATSVMVAAASLTVMTVAWVLAGAGLVGLLVHERGLRSAQVAGRKAVVAFTISDGALVLATLLVLATAGDLSLRDTTEAAAAIAGREVLGLPLGDVVAVLVVVAAIARSAQFPLGGWLAGTIAAPTPVSALLHAGVVNAGGILLVTLAPIVLLAPAAVGLAFAVGALTALWGTVLMLARPDIKGRLAHSTMGQMGFMVLQASIGALAAAIFHLVAHGMYKATLFLGSGSVIHERERLRQAPVPVLAAGRGGVDAALAALASLALVVAAVALLAPGLADDAGGLVLLAFAWAAAAQAAFWWLRLRRPGAPLRIAGALAALAVAVAGYVVVLDAVKTFLAPDLPGEGASGWAPAWLVVVVLAIAGSALALRWLGDVAPGRAARLAARLAGAHRAAYALVRRAGDVPAVAPLRTIAPRPAARRGGTRRPATPALETGSR